MLFVRSMATLSKRIEILANAAIIVVAALLVAVLVKNYLLPSSTSNPILNQIQPGSKLVLPKLDWSKSDKTLLLALSDGCKFCTESAEFYRRLVEERAKRPDLRLVAVLPQEVDRGQNYLNSLNVAVDEVRQIPLSSVGVTGTPTLIMVNKSGIITNIWLGKLSLEKETEVFSQLGNASK